MGNTGFILIHGAGLGSWIWDRLTPFLKSPYLAIDAPGRGKHHRTKTKDLSLNDYALTAMRDVGNLPVEKVIIVGHSSGGITGLELAALMKDRLAGFVGLSAIVPKAGGSFASSMPGIQSLFLRAMINFAGTKPPESAIRKGLCSGLDIVHADEVVRRFIPESKQFYTDKTSYKKMPPNSLYIITDKDKQLTATIQGKMAANLKAKHIQHLATGHMPMLEQPQILAGILNQYAAGMLY